MLRRLSNILKRIKGTGPGHSKDALTEVFRLKYEHFKELLDSNSELSKIISELEEKLQGDKVFGMAYVRSQSARAIFHALRMIRSFDALSDHRYPMLLDVFEGINSAVKDALRTRTDTLLVDPVLPYDRITAEMADCVGGKNANLGEIKNRVHLPVPSGFAITTRAFERFLADNDLVDEIAMKKMALDPEDAASINVVSEEIQRLIINAPVPQILQDAILSAYDDLVPEKTSPTGMRISMRSSAVGEDSELSFAGQYLSVLNVTREEILKTYKFVIASLFTPRAVSYRLMKGIPHEQAAMSVACIRMIDSVVSGVMYSRHPFDPCDDSIIISAVWGLGPYAVDGTITPDKYRVSRSCDLTDRKIAHKAVQLVANPDGGLREEIVETGRQDIACLSDEQIKTLAGYALRLEHHYGVPQDIEWALDSRGELYILQSRRLGTTDAGSNQSPANVPVVFDTCEHPILIDSGAAAYPGIGCGKAFQVHSLDDLADCPEGAVLVASQPSPKYMVVMPKVKAIVTDFGSITGHMASLCREFSLPTLLDTKKATSVIPDGMEITVDVFSKRVYRGIIPELLALQKTRLPYMKGTPVYETLKVIAGFITPLRLLNPKSPDFLPQNCKSLHDLMRFIHELSYSEMFRISDFVSEHPGFAVKLTAPIPLDLYVIDLGGGIAGGEEKARRVKHDRIVSMPFRALLDGMLHEDLVVQQPRPIEFRGFLSVMGEQMLSAPGTERFGDRSYAIISDKYLNFSSRVGYHYGVLDTYCGKTLSKNYIVFSFKGGAADDIRKNRRARAIALVLETLGMTVEVRGDRVDARLQKLDASLITVKLEVIGRLLQFTRQMDMLMTSEETVGAIAKAFLQENYHL